MERVIVNARYSCPKLPTIFTSNYEDIPGSIELPAVRVGFSSTPDYLRCVSSSRMRRPGLPRPASNADAEDILVVERASYRQRHLAPRPHRRELSCEPVRDGKPISSGQAAVRAASLWVAEMQSVKHPA